MTVFIVCSDCRDDSFEIEKVYATREDAVKHLEKFGPPRELIKQSDSFWRGKSEILTIQEYEVIE